MLLVLGALGRVDERHPVRASGHLVESVELPEGLVVLPPLLSALRGRLLGDLQAVLALKNGENLFERQEDVKLIRPKQVVGLAKLLAGSTSRSFVFSPESPSSSPLHPSP